MENTTVKRLSAKQKNFANAYIESGDATESVIKAGYKVKDKHSASSIGIENLKKLDVMEYIREHSPQAALNIVKLGNTARSESVKYQANRDILDRGGYKPTENQEPQKHIHLHFDLSALSPEKQLSFATTGKLDE